MIAENRAALLERLALVPQLRLPPPQYQSRLLPPPEELFLQPLSQQAQAQDCEHTAIYISQFRRAMRYMLLQAWPAKGRS